MNIESNTKTTTNRTFTTRLLAVWEDVRQGQRSNVAANRPWVRSSK